MPELNLAHLRRANRLRLPQFKDKHGRLCHTKPDGSDWSLSDWLSAMLGELGEYAELLQESEAFEEDDERIVALGKELGDVQCYLDFVAMRCLDQPSKPHMTGVHLVHSEVSLLGASFSSLVAAIGLFANNAKKFRRGDLNFDQWRTLAAGGLKDVQAVLDNHAAAVGIDIGQATMDKFNEISRRVGADVRLDDNGVYRLEAHA